MLNSGTLLSTKSGSPVKILDLLGSGGQGEVYRVVTDEGEKALKWYFPSSATPEQRGIIERLITIEVNERQFLWPQELVIGSTPDEFGYTMLLRPESYRSLPELFRRRVPGITLRALIMANISIVEAYRALHSKGIAYRDISWGNVFFDPVTGDALVCDNDNAVFEGQRSGVEGTMVFMAPELVRREGRPSTQTDLHSLAVLLFMMLMNEHPLHGARELEIHCMDAQAQRRLYGDDPLFIFHPTDRSNRAVVGEHDNARLMWDLLPQSLRDLFTEAFTIGLQSPDARIREGQWLDALTQVLDGMVYCPACGRQNFHDYKAHQRTKVTGTCWKCRKGLSLPPHMVIAGHVIMLNRDSVIYSHHVTPTASRDFQGIVALVTEHPAKPGVYGLTNQTNIEWVTRSASGAVTNVAPGKTVPLKHGLELNLGGAKAEIRGWPA